MSGIEDKYPAAGEIVIFQPEFVEFGGEERVILSLSKELLRQGKPHSVLCYWDHINLAQYATWPLAVNQLKPTKSPISRVLSLRRCLRYIKKVGSPTPVLFNIQSAFHAGIAINSPYHVRIPDTYCLLDFRAEGEGPTVQSVLKSVKSRCMKYFVSLATRRGIQRAVRFVTNTNALRNEMQSLYKRGAEVIYLGGFNDPRLDEPKRMPRPINLLSVSRIQNSKRIDWMLHALAEINQDAESYPEWKLHIAGAGPDRQSLESLSDSLGLKNFVFFHGFVSDEKLLELYEMSHIFLMPAKQGFGLPAIEALDRKLGLVVSDESGVVELLTDTNWVAIAHGGRAGFAAAIKDMLLRVAKPDFFDQPLPNLPTERGWANNIIIHFGW